ncbi:MAG: hypothetical protein LBJ61_09555, partial [Deltaproteobacteria bacterium]|nr:hypothetical protein [Deltaproteobacteria bacterium]
MDYEEYFKLSQRPFKPTLEAKFFYRGEVFDKLCRLLTEPVLPPLVVLTGPEGAGKSECVKRLPQAVSGESRMTPALDPTANFPFVLRQALTFLGLGFKCPPSARDEELLGFFQNAVDETLLDGLGFILAVDDADGLNPETLSDLLTLSRLDPAWHGRFCLFLTGTAPDPGPGPPPEVDPVELWLPEEAIGEALRLELKPLSLGETIEYTRHRLAVAGATKELFTAEALTTLRNLSKGLPGTINALAERSLMTAWAAGKNPVTTAHVIQAKANFDKPIVVNEKAAKVAAGAGRERERQKIGGRPWLSFVAAALLAGIMAWLLWPSNPGPDAATVAALPQSEDALPLAPGPQATPSAEPAPEGALGLPSLPPSVLNLPQTGVALVVENGQKMARLWQGGGDVPGLKAEIAAPDFKEPGLYLVGRPNGSTPIIFRYPPKADIPKTAAANLWKRVENLLPQDILPLMVGPGQELAKAVPSNVRPYLTAFLDRWVSAQTGKKAKEMADLYSENFSFFEPGRKPVSISR